MLRELEKLNITAYLILGAVLVVGCSNQFDLKGNNPFTRDNPTPVPTVINNPPPAGTHTDSFTQSSAAGKVDIVWVIDSSGSMSEEQTSLSNNADAFTQKLVDGNIDFRLIVISTGAANNSELVSQCKAVLGDSDGIITPATANKFNNCAMVGTSGSGSEAGLEAARRALDPNYPGGALNPNFRRADANLQLIFVSDEEEQPEMKNSTEAQKWLDAGFMQSDLDQVIAEMTPDLGDSGLAYDAGAGYRGFLPLVSNYESYFDDLVGADHEVHGHAIVQDYVLKPGDPNYDTDVCHQRNSGSPTEVGQRYMSYADVTVGTISAVCGDWSATMNQIGLEAASLGKCFKLAHAPTDISSIVGEVNGVVEPGSYSAKTQKYCFFKSAPPANAAISITYN